MNETGVSVPCRLCGVPTLVGSDTPRVVSMKKDMKTGYVTRELVVFCPTCTAANEAEVARQYPDVWRRLTGEG